ncbi:Trk system potassium transporter TrkA [Micavibrio aeruginosavorus]|uniref:Trk system potassium uptake protein TrkA n=1 Tax=Micavibrio aeruginosavorus (strain ARL-13) TaxID=856793 RepID=G2KRP1_MICAA|nr:Trk system potassium transporter TrkA [Micavibrio aeruginosavorus]AEP09603.1 trkA-C domain protein [Micavibrio aeruginosavorus ARL-13]
MRVIICGAGQVGYNIAAYLSREDNDVTVIDILPDLVAKVNETLDANGIVGHASNPDVLSAAGAADVDLMIAVTQSDEVNMVACQVAHSLFNVPKKIARVRDRAYMKPEWSNLFTRAHMPIDVIISPEMEVAHAICERLRVPGTTNVMRLAEGRVHLVGVMCGDNCPVINTPLKQLTSLFPSLSLKVAAIIRGQQAIIPNENEQMYAGDEVYFFTDTDHLQRAMAAFGHQEKEARHVTVLGGGNIGMYLTRILQEQSPQTRIRVIEHNLARAMTLSEQLRGISIMHGDGLEPKTLEDADMANTETMVAVTDDDETNILAALLAKQAGCERVISLVNKVSYTPLIKFLDIDAMVTPRAITVASIMQHVRRGRIKALHSLRDGFAEVIEAEVSDTSSIVNTEIGRIKLPRDVLIGAIVRGDDVLMPQPDLKIRSGDHVIVLATQAQARKVEKLFLVHVDLF